MVCRKNYLQLIFFAALMWIMWLLYVFSRFIFFLNEASKNYTARVPMAYYFIPPVPIRTPKLNGIERCQYIGGWLLRTFHWLWHHVDATSLACKMSGVENPLPNRLLSWRYIPNWEILPFRVCDQNYGKSLGIKSDAPL